MLNVTTESGCRVRIVFNADDFGRSFVVNRAVRLAYREGLLTSASLMVTGDAAEEAVELARAMPGLAVGLHLVLTEGRPALPSSQIPHLVQHKGRFPSSPALVWILYFTSSHARAEMAREIRAQFERFAATGMELSHVDSHQHIHLHPAVFRALLPLCRQYRARGLRLPRDDFWLAIGYDRRDAVTKAASAVVFNLLCRQYARLLKEPRHEAGGPLGEYRPAVTERVFGVLQSGRMEEAYVLRLLRSLRAGTTELYFHPTTAPEHVRLGANPGDLATLLSPAVRQTIEARGIALASYAALVEES